MKFELENISLQYSCFISGLSNNLQYLVLSVDVSENTRR